MAFMQMQVQINTNNAQAFAGAAASGGNADAQALPGVFDSLMTEYAAASSDLNINNNLKNLNNNNAAAHESSSLNFAQISQNILDILAAQQAVSNDEANINLNKLNNLSGLEDLIAEFEDLNLNLDLDLNDEDAKNLLANLAEKIIVNYADKLSSSDANKLNILTAAVKDLKNLNNNLSNLNLSSSSSSELLSNISSMSEAELQTALAGTIQNVLNNLVSRQVDDNNNLERESGNLNLNNYNKILNSKPERLAVNDNINDEDDNSNSGSSEDNADDSEAGLKNLSYEFNNNYAALNNIADIANKGAAESPSFFTQASQASSASTSQDYSASQISTSTSERSLYSSTIQSTTSLISLKSQNARSSQSISAASSEDSESATSSQKSEADGGAFQKVLSNIKTGTENESNANGNNENENKDENKNENGSGNEADNAKGAVRQENSNKRTNNLSNLNNNNLNKGSVNNNRAEAANAHNDFQSFFEGALYNRRSLVRSEAAPLNLRPDNNYNYTRAETLRDGIVNVVRFTRADGVHKANMIVDPPALGRISVELTSSTSGVEASIKVVNEQVRQLVQDQITELRMTLEQQGVQVTQFAVDVQQDNAGRQQEQQEQSGQGRRRVNALGGLDAEDEGGAAEEFRIDLNEGLLYWVA